MDAKNWKCGASEALTVYPAIRFFVETVLEQHPSLQLRCASFCTLCDVLDLMQEAKRGVAPWILNAIRVKARAFLTLTQAEDSQHVRPAPLLGVLEVSPTSGGGRNLARLFRNGAQGHWGEGCHGARRQHQRL